MSLKIICTRVFGDNFTKFTIKRKWLSGYACQHWRGLRKHSCLISISLFHCWKTCMYLRSIYFLLVLSFIFGCYLVTGVGCNVKQFMVHFLRKIMITMFVFRWWWWYSFCLTVIRRVSHVEQELVSLPEHLNSPQIFDGFRVARSLFFFLFSFDNCNVCPFSIYGF